MGFSCDIKFFKIMASYRFVSITRPYKKKKKKGLMPFVRILWKNTKGDNKAQLNEHL